MIRGLGVTAISATPTLPVYSTPRPVMTREKSRQAVPLGEINFDRDEVLHKASPTGIPQLAQPQSEPHRLKGGALPGGERYRSPPSVIR